MQLRAYLQHQNTTGQKPGLLHTQTATADPRRHKCWPRTSNAPTSARHMEHMEPKRERTMGNDLNTTRSTRAKRRVPTSLPRPARKDYYVGKGPPPLPDVCRGEELRKRKSTASRTRSGGGTNAAIAKNVPCHLSRKIWYCDRKVSSRWTMPAAGD